MSGIEAGIPLIRTGSYWRATGFVDDGETHRAYPVEYARQLEAVAEAGARWRIASEQFDPSSFRSANAVASARCALIAALDALAAAGSES